VAGNRNRLDVGRISALAQRPGIDPRVNLVTAVVREIGYDPDNGVFADVYFEPDGPEETVLVGTSYAGNGFGDWNPLEKDDVVLVAVPLGDPNTGAVIIARMWSAADKPPSDFAGPTVADGVEPTRDRIIRVKAGQNIKIIVSGGGNVNLTVEDAGKVYLGESSGTHAVGDGVNLKSYLDSLKTWAQAHTHTYIPGTLASAPTSPPVASPPAPTDAVKLTKVEGK
jgi:hypothetical protein